MEILWWTERRQFSEVFFSCFCCSGYNCVCGCWLTSLLLSFRDRFGHRLYGFLFDWLLRPPTWNHRLTSSSTFHIWLFAFLHGKFVDFKKTDKQVTDKTAIKPCSGTNCRTYLFLTEARRQEDLLAKCLWMTILLWHINPPHKMGKQTGSL